MSKKCLYCYEEVEESTAGDFHERCSLAFFGTKKAPLITYSLDQMADLAKNVVERHITVPGVQPKLSLTLVKETLAGDNTGRLTIVGTLGGNYILKPPSEYYPEMPANEHLTMRMAEAFDIRTVPSTLIRLQSGEFSYLTRRVDRTVKGEKIHMLDMFQVLEAFDKYKSSLEKVGKAIGTWSDNTLLDKLYFFELCVFCFITGNNDMHLKNFSMLNAGNEWVLSPAYDLLNVTIANPDDSEELALTLEGKKKKINREHFERLGNGLGLNQRQVESVFNRFIKSKPLALRWIDNSFLTADYQQRYKTLLEERYARIIV